MSEPITGAAGRKRIGGLAGMGTIGAGLALVVVMSMTRPKTEREWRVALICTAVGSIGGGAAVVQYCGLEHWAHTVVGLAAMFGLAFACGLPVWCIVRALFKYVERRSKADLIDIVKEVKEVL